MKLLQKVTAKPWQHAGELHGLHGEHAVLQSPGRTGLTIFLLVITSLFGLTMFSYYSRSQYPDWEMLTEPGILWLNTVLLVLASIAMQTAANAGQRQAMPRARNAVYAAAVLTVAFIAGQLAAWNQLVDAGFYAQANPAYASFYLLTGLHALHLLGGLWYLGRLLIAVSSAAASEALAGRLALCTTYWHYLLLIWLVMFGLLQVT